MLRSYTFCGEYLLSDTEIPELTNCAKPLRESSLRARRIRWHPAPNPEALSSGWPRHLLEFLPLPQSNDDFDFHRKELDGQIWLSVKKLDGYYLMYFRGSAYFVVTENDNRIDCIPLQGVPRETLHHLLLDVVLPYVFHSPRKLVLHASAVVRNGQCVAFIGKSGAGKSSLAAELCYHGWQLLTDDTLVLEIEKNPVLAIPSYPSLRLWPDTAQKYEKEATELDRVAHYHDKLRIKASPRDQSSVENFDQTLSSCINPTPLRRLLCLEVVTNPKQAKECEILPSSAHETFIKMVESSFTLDPLSAETAQLHFAQVRRLLNEVPVQTLRYSWTENSTKAIVQRLNLEVGKV